MSVITRKKIILPWLAALLFVIAALFLFIPESALATGPVFTISGADISALNGMYTDCGVPQENGKPFYWGPNGEPYVNYTGGQWELVDSYNLRYRSDVDTDIPPITGWRRADGSTDNDFLLSYGPSLSLSDTNITVNETACGVTLRINLSEFPMGATVNYTISGGTAEDGSDFYGGSGQLFINGGSTYTTLGVTIIDDTKFEGNETFTVTISSPSGAPVTNGTCTVTIVSDDPQAKAGFASATKSANESEESVILPVTLDIACDTAVTLHYATANGSALAGSDYTATSGDIEIPIGEKVGSISIPLLNDPAYEGSETFTVTLSSPQNAALATSTITVTITDDESAPTVGFEFTTASMSESGASVSLAVKLSVPCQSPMTVQYTTANATATAGSDYTLKSGTLAFDSGVTKADLHIFLLGDTIYEGSETFTVNLSSPSLGSLGSASATVTLTDDDPMPQADFALFEVTANETEKKAVLTVTLTGQTQLDTTIQYTAQNGTATDGDYTGAAGTLIIPRSSALGTIEIPIVDDNVYEGGDESFTVTLSSPLGATLGTAVATVIIEDNDSVPKISFASTAYSSTENMGAAALPLTLTNPSQSAITVNYITDDSTAKAGSDYTASSGSLTVPPYSETATLNIDILNDIVYEGSESFTVTLSSPAGATLGINQAEVTITDDETKPLAGFALATQSGEEDDGAVMLTVSLSGPSKTDITMEYVTSDGTAKKIADYVESSGTVTILAGYTSATFGIPLVNNTVYEAEESFTVTLLNPIGADLGAKTVTVQITDDEPVPVLSFEPATPSADENADKITLTVTLSGQTQQDVTALFETADGTAKAGKDYTLRTGTLTIPAGSLTGTLDVFLREDTLFEGPETFTVALSDPAVAALDRDTATVTIIDNESMPQVYFDPATVTRYEDAPKAVLTVRLTGQSQADVTVQFETEDGTAFAGSDYTSASGTLTILGGDTTATVEVTLTDDTVYEGGESFLVTLSAPQGASLGAQSFATVQLTDDEPMPSIGFAPTAVTLNENESQAALTLKLSNVCQADTAVSLKTASGTAMQDEDYTEVDTLVTIPAGQTAATVNVPLSDDDMYEGSEAFTAVLTSPLGAVLGADTAIVTLTDTESKPQISFDPLTISPYEDSGKAVLTVRLSGLSQADVSAAYATANGSAKAGQDYLSAAGTVVIPGRSLNSTVEITLLNDDLYEGQEEFTVSLSTPHGATVSGGTAEVIIRDDEAEPKLSFVQKMYTFSEGDARAALTLMLTSASQSDITVEYVTVDGSASAGTDYTQKRGTLTVPAGSTDFTFYIPLREDEVYEDGEDFTVTLSNAQGAILLGSVTTVSITDNETVPRIGFTAAALTKGENAGTAALTVRLSGLSKTDTSVVYETQNQTAKAGVDFEFTSGTLVIPAGSLSAALEIALVNDSTYENDEAFTVVLSGPAGATLETDTAIITVTDGDPAPRIGFEATVLRIGEAQQKAEITVRLLTVSGADTSVTYSTADGTAKKDSDYLEQSGTLTIPAGSLTQVIVLPLKPDTIYEGDEAFTVLLSSPQNAVLAEDKITVELTESKPIPSVSFYPAAYLIRESAGEATITLTLSHLSSKETTVRYETAERSASDNLDFKPASGTVTFPALTKTKTIKVGIVNDAEYENTESFVVTLSGAAGLSIQTAQTSVSIADNDPKPTPTPALTAEPGVLTPTPSPEPTVTPTPAPVPAATADPKRYQEVPPEAVAAELAQDEYTGEAATVASVSGQAVEDVIAAARQAQQEGGAPVLHFPDIQALANNSAVKLTLPSAQMQNAAQEGMGVSVRMDNVTFEVPSGVLLKAAEDSTSMSLECREADGTVPAFRIDGGSGEFIGPAFQYALAVTRAGGDMGYVDKFETPVVIVIHLTKEQAEAITDPGKVTMYFVDPYTGKTEALPTSFDPAAMTLTFTTLYFAEEAEE